MKKKTTCTRIIEEKVYSIEVSVEETFKIILTEKDPKAIMGKWYQGSYTIEQIRKVSECFTQIKTLDEVFVPISKALQSDFFVLNYEDNKMNQIIDFFLAKVTFQLFPSSQQQKDKSLKEFSVFFSQMKETLEQNKKKFNKLIRLLVLTRKEKEKLEEENKALMKENQNFKKMIDEFMNSNNLSKINSDLNYIKANVLRTDREKEAEKEKERINKALEPKLVGDLATESVIVCDKESKELLCDWINPNKQIKTTLLYKPTRDGDNAKAFHNKCDNKGPTLALIKTTKGYKFGGFTTQNWKGSGHKYDNDAFLFFLEKKQKYPINSEHYAIDTHPESNLYFECIDIGGDGFLNNHMGKINAIINSYYKVPNFSLLKGELDFEVEEIEVYQIQ